VTRSLIRRLRAGAGRRVADPRAVYLVTEILADSTARVRTLGLANALNTRAFAAVKTGASKDMRDNWCIGFTDRYTIGVWIGNAGGEAMHDGSGVSGAAPIWQALALFLHAQSPSRKPAAQDGTSSRSLHRTAEPCRRCASKCARRERKSPRSSGNGAVIRQRGRAIRAAPHMQTPRLRRRSCAKVSALFQFAAP
jgi:penicillin-binding protein 1C